MVLSAFHVVGMVGPEGHGAEPNESEHAIAGPLRRRKVLMSVHEVGLERVDPLESNVVGAEVLSLGIPSTELSEVEDQVFIVGQEIDRVPVGLWAILRQVRVEDVVAAADQGVALLRHGTPPGVGAWPTPAVAGFLNQAPTPSREKPAPGCDRSGSLRPGAVRDAKTPALGWHAWWDCDLRAPAVYGWNANSSPGRFKPRGGYPTRTSRRTSASRSAPTETQAIGTPTFSST